MKNNLKQVWETRASNKIGAEDLNLNNLGVKKSFERDIIVNWLKDISEKQNLKTKPLKLLDGGCSIGEYLIIAKSFGFNVCGIDISEKAINVCKKKNLKCVLGDVRKLPFKDKEFDIVTSGGVVEHFPDSEKAIAEASRVLKSNGILLIGVPYRYSFFVINKKLQQILGLWPIGYEKSFSKRNLTKILGNCGFEIKKIKMKPVGHGKRFPLVSSVIRKLDKLLNLFGLGGHHIILWCIKK